MDICSNNHEYWMQKALTYAKKAQDIDEVPVGAIIIKDNKLIAHAFNQSITKNDPCAHAEILVLRKAAKKLNNYRLNGCKLYCTLEPCMMCTAAIREVHIDKVYFGAYDDKKVGIESIIKILKKDSFLKPEVYGGINELECSNLIKNFFKEKRL